MLNPDILVHLRERGNYKQQNKTEKSIVFDLENLYNLDIRREFTTTAIYTERRKHFPAQSGFRERFNAESAIVTGICFRASVYEFLYQEHNRKITDEWDNLKGKGIQAHFREHVKNIVRRTVYVDIIVKKPTEIEKSEMLIQPIWECNTSEFDWYYDSEEMCLLLEGEVTVTYEDRKISFGAGDYVVFPKGLSCVWKVTKPVRKHYVFK